MSTKRLIILSGPSCVGKGPLIAALNTYYPDIVYKVIPIIKSKESRPNGPRPDEQHQWDNPAYFRSNDDILKHTSNEEYLVGTCRGFPQALDLKQIKDNAFPLLFIEAHHTIGTQLKNKDYLKTVDVKTIFLSPLGKQEIIDLKQVGVDTVHYLSQIMLHKLTVRARFQGKKINEALFADIIMRANEAPEEIRNASNYNYIIVNHDAEGNPNWHRSPEGIFENPPEADAKRALISTVNIFLKGEDNNVEHWDSPLF
jgi:guanylate kinase